LIDPHATFQIQPQINFLCHPKQVHLKQSVQCDIKIITDLTHSYPNHFMIYVKVGAPS